MLLRRWESPSQLCTLDWMEDNHITKLMKKSRYWAMLKRESCLSGLLNWHVYSKLSTPLPYGVRNGRIYSPMLYLYDKWSKYGTRSLRARRSAMGFMIHGLLSRASNYYSTSYWRCMNKKYHVRSVTTLVLFGQWCNWGVQYSSQEHIQYEWKWIFNQNHWSIESNHQ